MKMEGAFIHHYEKHGVEAHQFQEAFIRCEETLEAYKRL